MMSDTGLRKDRLRKHFLEVRNKMTPEEREEKSRQILVHLAAWEHYRKSDTVHCFMTIEKNSEVNTNPILSQLARNGKRVVVPRTAEGRTLEHVLYNNSDTMKTNSLGISEPSGGDLISVDELDLVLVPLIAADTEKNRLGYGQGYYDRFLAQTDALKAGLLFECCLSAELLPTQHFDVPLDYLISERGIY